jgi:DNA repair protein RadA/Sms
MRTGPGAKAGREQHLFVCSKCERREPKWLGRCPNCGEWNSFREVAAGAATASASGEAPLAVPLAAIEADPGLRVPSGNGELDRVLGGGFMRGSTTLIGGEPGVGKSTLLLQIGAKLQTAGRVLYVSAEESAEHLRLRADRLRLQAPRLEVWAGAELGELLRLLDSVRPAAVIVDSLQALTAAGSSAQPGAVNQIKEICDALTGWTHARNAITVLVAHVTKEGGIAGPKAIEHMVDVVLSFETGNAELRFLRASKNRFGPVEEVALFEMTGRGLRQLADPSSRFVEHADASRPPPGVAVAAIYEGSRVLCVEVQALVVPAQRTSPRIVSDRIDVGRVARIAAVLQRSVQLPFLDRDIYMNVAGGLRLRDVAADLPIALALYGARTELTPATTLAAFGEITLAGQMRRAAGTERRLRAAAGLGIHTVLAPGPLPADGAAGWQAVTDVRQAVRAAMVPAGAPTVPV